AFAIYPHLAFADHTLDAREAEGGESRLQKPVNSHAVFVGTDRDILHAAPCTPLPPPSDSVGRFSVIPRRARFERGTARAVAFRASLGGRRVTAKRRESMPRPGNLFAAAGLARSAIASQEPPRSFRSRAQYSSRFLISRSNPRSGGS